MTKLEQCIQKIDELNSVNEKTLIQSKHMTEMLLQLYPQADEVLQISARAFHVERWIIPRTDYQMDRVGYLQWRTKLKEHHAERTSLIMQELGFEPHIIEETKKTIERKFIKSHTYSQQLEDIASLVFLKHEFDEFTEKHTTEKCVEIVNKTWLKISTTAKQFALTLNFSAKAKHILSNCNLSM